MLFGCQNTDQLYLHSFGNDLSNKDKLQFYLFVTSDTEYDARRSFSFSNFDELSRPWSIYQYSEMALVLFSLYRSLLWELRDKRNLKHLQF